MDRSIKVVKIKYEVRSENETSKITFKQKAPKNGKKSKVKQFASLLNSKMSQMVKRNVSNYTVLHSEYSPEPKPQVATSIITKPPLPMPRIKAAKPPIPMPRKKFLANVSKPKLNACFVPEDDFAKLSVKEKALLYTKFVEETEKRNPQFSLMETAKVQREKQVSVKNMLDKLESNSVSPKSNTAAAKAMQRMDSMKRTCEARRSFLQKIRKFEDFLNKSGTTIDTSLASAQNATNNQQSSISNEAYQTTDPIYENITTESLFFSWLQQKQENDNHGDDVEDRSEIDEEKQKSIVNKNLEEASAKLETVKAEQRTFEIPKQMPRKLIPVKSSSTSSAKPTETEESESGVSSLHKITSEESQANGVELKINKSQNVFEFGKPLKPLRKKKLRKNPVLKKEEKQNENQQPTSTDSDPFEHKKAKLNNNEQSLQEDARKQSEQYRPSLEFNPTLFKTVNSPRKIKSAYTLTINDLETPICTPRPSLHFAKQTRESRLTSVVPKRQISLSDSLTDQGFVTATNDVNSPLKKSAMQERAETINFPVKPDASNSSNGKVNYSTPVGTQVQEKVQHRSLLTSTLNSTNDVFEFSTPIKTKERHSFAATTFSAKRLLSPIAKSIKNRRKSFYDVESARTSLVMQVIKEDQPLEPQQTSTKNNYNETKQQFIVGAPPTVANSQLKGTKMPEETVSHFWIKCGDFSVTLDVDYVNRKRIVQLYEIFSKTSCDTKDLYFGIDNNKFSVHEPLDTGSSSNRTQASRQCSHYWFSTGDLTIPFSGKMLNSQKIERLFRIMKETVEETGVLRFGVDDFEFSNVPEFWYQEPKFSVASQYNMLVGLQCGNSDGLEGRSKYAWPHITDFNQTDNESDKYYNSDCNRLSSTPFGNNCHNLAALNEVELSMPRNSLAMMNLESYCDQFTNEPFDKVFQNSCNEEQQEPFEQAPAKSAPEIIYPGVNEKERLSAIQDQHSNYANLNPSYMAKAYLDRYKGTPEYVEKLKAIVSEINNICCSDNFKLSTADELQSYMVFLMDALFNALADYKPESA